ncbi:toll-like receptor 4 [Ylistrum balloti]|uniref:toll-like receptor 4 n=1 Tax=Ylistrum balloti TaxID=509963 RepID=UPI002905ED02|nr:toll-like receptor 4 [Ylistrum balloti]
MSFNFFIHLLFTLSLNTFYGVRAVPESCPVPCSCIYKGKTIKTLDCSDLNWERIPPKFGFPSSIIRLSLANNKLAVLHNGTFRNLPDLQTLDVSHNQITVLENSCFEGLKSLINLNMSYNSLKMTTEVYSPGIFRFLKKLKVLNIHGNIKQSTENQNYPDVALSDVQSLKALTMDGLPNIAFGEGFRNLRYLTTLDMSVRDDESSCVLLDIRANTFTNLSNSTLSELRLIQCDIYRVARGAFSMLKHLTELDLSKNDRMSFAGMKNASFGLDLTNIQILYLNGINRHSDPWTLKQSDFVYFNMTNIKVLTLDSNRITNIEGGVIDILPTSLELLTIRENYLTDAHFLANLVHLNNLLVFDVSYQLDYSIREKLGETLQHENHTFPALSIWTDGKRDRIEKVQMAGSVVAPTSTLTRYFKKVAVVSQQSTMEPKKLRYISSRPDRKKMDDMIYLPVKVKKILGSNLKINPLSAPPLTFDSNNSLEYVDLSSNGVHAWYGKWSGLHSLSFLNISFNAMFRLAPDTFGDMANLHTLLLNGNRLGLTIMQDKQFLTFSNQTKLTYLNLSDNGFTDLPEFVFTKQINLKQLDLQQNFLSVISFRMKSLKNIREINLSNNTITRLTRINMDEMDYLVKLSNFTIDLTGNPLLCTCDQLQQLRWMKVRKFLFRNLKRYTCKASNGSIVYLAALDDITGQMEMDCVAMEVVYICLGVFFGLCLFLSLPALAYYKQSRMMYLFSVGRKHVVPLGKNVQQDEEANQDQFEFTVYFSHDPSANEFVKRFEAHMKNKGVSMCIPELHWDDRFRETTGIVHAMNNSACVVAFIDNDYMLSFHRLFEFEVAVTEGIQNRFNNLIVVLLEDLDAKHFQMNDFVVMYCRENHYFDVRRSGGKLFGELENEIIRYKEFKRKSTRPF